MLKPPFREQRFAWIVSLLYAASAAFQAIFGGTIAGIGMTSAISLIMNPRLREYWYGRTGISIPKWLRALIVVVLMVLLGLFGTMAAPASGPDETKILFVREGIDDGLTLGSILDGLRKAKTIVPERIAWEINEGGWFDEKASFEIEVSGDIKMGSKNLSPITITIVPYLGGTAYFVSQIGMAGEESSLFKDKVFILKLFTKPSQNRKR